MGFQPVVPVDRSAAFGLVGCIVLAAWSARRSEPMRAAWGGWGERGGDDVPHAAAAIFVLVGLVDSLHYRERLVPAGAGGRGEAAAVLEVRSALDAWPSPAHAGREDLLGAAGLAALRQADGGGQGWRPAPGVSAPQVRWRRGCSIRSRISPATWRAHRHGARGGSGRLAGAGGAGRGAGGPCSRRVPLAPAGGRWRGKGGLAWRAMLLTLAGVLLLVGPSRRWPPNTTCSAPTRWGRTCSSDPQEHPHGAGDRHLTTLVTLPWRWPWASSRVTWAAGWMT